MSAPSSPLVSLLVGFLVAGLAWWTGALSRGGALAAAGIGTAILSGTGWEGGAVLLAFFIPSTLVSRLLPDPTNALLDPRDHRRDHWQVLANGGVAGLGGLLGLQFPDPAMWIVTASLAAAAADTWSTSWGARSPRPPYSIISGLPVPAGTSGGVTIIGTLGGALGGVLVAACAAILAHDARFLAAGGVGFLGMAADSVIGALWQGKFRCSRCDCATERRVHKCGTRSTSVSGLGWLTNDGVNAVATTLAGLGGVALWLWSSSH